MISSTMFASSSGFSARAFFRSFVVACIVIGEGHQRVIRWSTDGPSGNQLAPGRSRRRATSVRPPQIRAPCACHASAGDQREINAQLESDQVAPCGEREEEEGEEEDKHADRDGDRRVDLLFAQTEPTRRLRHSSRLRVIYGKEETLHCAQHALYFT